MKKAKITIIRTAVGSPASVGLINELRKRDIRVIGTDCNDFSVGFYLCDKYYVVPKGNDPNFLKEILKICKTEKVRAILAGLEEEQLTLAKNKKIFDSQNILVLFPDFETIKMCSDKILTHDFFQKEKIPAPKIYTKNDIKFPAIIKPKFGRGSVNIFKVKAKKELNYYLKKVKNPILQEFISGREYTVDMFSDLKGTLLSVVPRIRMQVESGISMKGQTVYDKEIVDFCQKIAEKLKLIGPSCVQCIKDERGPKFIEINTRFGGGSILSLMADPTILPNLIKIIKGERPIKTRGLKAGLTMLRYYSEIYIEKL